MNKNLIYTLVVIVVIVSGAWFWMNPVSSPTGGTSQKGVVETDNAASINQDLNAINVQDPDFNSIDADLNSL